MQLVDLSMGSICCLLLSYWNSDSELRGSEKKAQTFLLSSQKSEEIFNRKLLENKSFLQIKFLNNLYCIIIDVCLNKPFICLYMMYLRSRTEFSTAVCRSWGVLISPLLVGWCRICCVLGHW